MSLLIAVNWRHRSSQFCQVRLFSNFKITVNPQLIVKRRAIPIKEKIFKTLQVGRAWSQIDFTHAFKQYEVDKKSRDALLLLNMGCMDTGNRLGAWLLVQQSVRTFRRLE